MRVIPVEQLEKRRGDRGLVAVSSVRHLRVAEHGAYWSNFLERLRSKALRRCAAPGDVAAIAGDAGEEPRIPRALLAELDALSTYSGGFLQIKVDAARAGFRARSSVFSNAARSPRCRPRVAGLRELNTQCVVGRSAANFFKPASICRTRR